VKWREQVAVEKRAAFVHEDYWGRPVPGFGDPLARVMVLGLAPAAHGANRTGRMFTGDRSGDWLYRALHRAGFANQPTSERRDDGLRLRDAWVTSPVKCVPPANRPTTEERDNCRSWLESELESLERLEVIVCLGGFAWESAHTALADRGAVVPRPRPRFGHLVISETSEQVLVGSYHPSQQNTFTGRLTEGMFDAVFATASRFLSPG
jgi:uracil-DNA glycosylase family 4